MTASLKIHTQYNCNPSSDVCETWAVTFKCRVLISPLATGKAKGLSLHCFSFLHIFPPFTFLILGIHFKTSSPGHRAEGQVIMKFNLLWFSTFLNSTHTRKRVRCFLTSSTLKVCLLTEFLEQSSQWFDRCLSQ